MKKKKGCLVTKNTIYEVLTNPFYYGEMCVKGKIMPHIYTPLVSKDLFDKVQKILTQNGNHNRANVKESAKTVYTFRRMISILYLGISPKSTTMHRSFHPSIFFNNKDLLGYCCFTSGGIILKLVFFLLVDKNNPSVSFILLIKFIFCNNSTIIII